MGWFTIAVAMILIFISGGFGNILGLLIASGLLGYGIYLRSQDR